MLPESAQEEFHKKGEALIKIRKQADQLCKEERITKKENKKIKNLLLYEWRKNWNRHPDIPDSIKQAFNLLYS